MNAPPPPGYDSSAVQAPGGGARDEPSTFGTVLKWGLVVAGIWGIAEIAANVTRTSRAAADIAGHLNRKRYSGEPTFDKGMTDEELEFAAMLEEEDRRKGRG